MALVQCHVFQHIVKCINDVSFKSLYIYFHYRIKHFYMNIFLNIKIFKSYPIWPHKMAIFVVKISLNYDKCLSMPSFWIINICTFVLSKRLSVYGFVYMNNLIRLVNTICGVLTILVFTVGNFELLFKFFVITNSLDP